MNNYEEQIIDFLKANIMGQYVKITDIPSLRRIHSLLIHDIVDEKNLTHLEAYYFGLYYGRIKKDMDKLFHYLSFAMDGNIVEAIFEYAHWHTPSYIDNIYEYTEKEVKDLQIAINYFMKAFDHGHPDASEEIMFWLEKFDDIDELIKFQKFAIGHGCPHAMRELALRYGSEQNYDKMAQLFSMAIEKQDAVSISLLKEFCRYENTLSQKHFVDDQKLNDTVLLIVLKHGNLFTRKEIINCFKSVFNQRQIQNKKVYDCIVYFGFTEDDDCCELKKYQSEILVQYSYFQQQNGILTKNNKDQYNEQLLCQNAKVRQYIEQQKMNQQYVKNRYLQFQYTQQQKLFEQYRRSQDLIHYQHFNSKQSKQVVQEPKQVIQEPKRVVQEPKLIVQKQIVQKQKQVKLTQNQLLEHIQQQQKQPKQLHHERKQVIIERTPKQGMPVNLATRIQQQNLIQQENQKRRIADIENNVHKKQKVTK